MNELQHVHDAAQRRHGAIRDYRAAILTARAAGHTLAAIAAAAGITRQVVHDIIRRHEREDQP